MVDLDLLRSAQVLATLAEEPLDLVHAARIGQARAHHNERYVGGLKLMCRLLSSIQPFLSSRGNLFVSSQCAGTLRRFCPITQGSGNICDPLDVLYSVRSKGMPPDKRPAPGSGGVGPVIDAGSRAGAAGLARISRLRRQGVKSQVCWRAKPFLERAW